MLSFWGKAQPTDAAGSSWHPIAYHQLDVAACALELLERRPLALQTASRLLGLDADDANRFLVALVALHDIGKFTPAFQSMSPDHWPEALGARRETGYPRSHHTEDGLLLWQERLEQRFAARLWAGCEMELTPLMKAVFGHHGRPTSGRERPVSQVFGSGAESAATECVVAMLDLLLPSPIEAPVPSESRMQRASWWVAGFVTLADWVGSDEERFFKYHAPGLALDDYWTVARDASVRAIAEKGLLPAKPAALLSFTELTGRSSPTPLQAWANKVPLRDGPTLFVMEDVTGSGKTEAAQVLVHRLMSANRATGAYWAMPTQATSNAMYHRQSTVIEKLYDVSGPRPSLVLAHGQASLHGDFRASVMGMTADVGRVSAEVADEEVSSSASCAAYLAEDRRRSFLADLGAGTIDQALLGVLPAKFGTMRLLGLSEKVLVVDEAHAYDTYVNEELERLLEFQAALGGSAVVLSATLPLSKRENLVRAWQRGLGRKPARLQFSTGGRASEAGRRTNSRGFPLTTVVSGADQRADEQGVDVAERCVRTIELRLAPSLDEVLSVIETSVAAGAAVAWIRNTVDSCLFAAGLLRERGIEPLVFHARFAQGDRQRREQEVVGLFGEESTPDMRRGQVVIATQVIEQSLDLDFDVMISDLAPADLVLQRGGRFRRHAWRDALRPASVPLQLIVLAPQFELEPRPDWLDALLPGTKSVYSDPAILWRTLREFSRRPRIDVPSDVRELIEAVYDENGDCPESLLPRAVAASGQQGADRSQARHQLLTLADGYDGAAMAWIDEMKVQTRLQDRPTITVRLARTDDTGALVPWCDGEASWRRSWALSEIRVPAYKLPGQIQPQEGFEGAVDRVRSFWGKFEQEIPIVVLQESASGDWEAMVGTDKQRTVNFRYSAATGAQITGT